MGRVAWGAGEERGGGFALGFGFGAGGGGGFELVEEAGLGERSGFGVEQGGAGGVDAGRVMHGGLVVARFEQVGELLEREVVEAAQLQGRDGGVEEVLEQGVAEGGFEIGW